MDDNEFFEDTAFRVWEAYGLKCALRCGASGVCGYVQLPVNDPRLDINYLQIDVIVHGGLTFSADGWVGFDTAHAFDYWSPEALKDIPSDAEGCLYMSENVFALNKVKSARHFDDKSWTVDGVIVETESLARQLAQGIGPLKYSCA